MIVIISTEDIGIVKAAHALAKKYPQKLVFFEEGCFAGLKENEPVVFIGHADTDQYTWHGSTKLNAEQFLKQLEKFNFPFGKANKMYLEGCKINFGNNCFLRHLAQDLYKQQERQHIQLYGFSNLIGYKILKDMHVAIPYHENMSTVITEITPDQKATISHELKTFDAEQDSIFEKALEKCEAIKQVYNDLIQFFEEFQKKQMQISQEDYIANLNDFNNRLQKIKAESNPYFKEIHENIEKCQKLINSLMELFPLQKAIIISSVKVIKQWLDELNQQPDYLRVLLENAHRDKVDKLIKKYGTSYDLKKDIISALNANRSNLIEYHLLQNLNQFDENRLKIWGLINLRVANLFDQKQKVKIDFLGKLSKQISSFKNILNDIENPEKKLSEIIDKILANSQLLAADEIKAVKIIQQDILIERKQNPPTKTPTN